MTGVMFTPSTYGSGEQTLADLGYTTPSWYPNLVPDPGIELGTYAPTTDTALGADAHPDQYRIISSTVGSGGAISCTFDTALPHSGTRALRLATSTTGSPTNQLQVLSPNFDVEPGATYLVSGWITKTSAAVVKSYFRLVGGSDDTLTEYPGSNVATAIPSSPTWENLDLATMNVYQQMYLVCTIPAGITRASLRMISYQSTTGTTLLFDDLRVVKVDGSPFSDTGWVDIGVSNPTSFAPYGNVQPSIPKCRRIGNTVYFQGALSNLIANAAIDSSSPSTLNTFAVIPPIFRVPPVWGEPVWVCQGSSQNRWGLRLYSGTGNANAHRYGPDPSGVATWLPFQVQYTID